MNVLQKGWPHIGFDYDNSGAVLTWRIAHPMVYAEAEQDPAEQ